MELLLADNPTFSMLTSQGLGSATTAAALSLILSVVVVLTSKKKSNASREEEKKNKQEVEPPKQRRVLVIAPATAITVMVAMMMSGGGRKITTKAVFDNLFSDEEQIPPATTSMEVKDPTEDAEGATDSARMKSVVETGETRHHSTLYDCVYNGDRPLPKSKNDVRDYFEWYDKWNKAHEEEGLQYFRYQFYGGRGDTYNTMKERSRRFRVEVYGSELKSGEVFYESACGEGFTSLMTMEVLKEELGIDDLVVYGNDYIAKSTELANKVFDMIMEQHDGIQKGRFCQGDSTNLHFVPSSTFDLAFTGSLDTLEDPLNRSPPGLEEMEFEAWSRELCNSEDPQDIELLQREQRAQEEWHSAWVKELIRIVKPGKLVVIEDVGFPICEETSDWGGVWIEWWEDAIAEYGWDVDPDSLEIWDKEWYYNRYNVVMRKNEQ